jgi:hypothetical protein
MIVGRVEDRQNYNLFRQLDLEKTLEEILSIKDYLQIIAVKDGDDYIINPILNDIKDKLTSDDITKIGQVISSLNKINQVVELDPKLTYVYNNKTTLDLISVEIDNIKKVLESLDKVKTLYQDMCISVDRSKSFAIRSKDSYEAILDLFNTKIKPNIDRLEVDLINLKNETITIKEEIENSHELALKFFEYDHVINVTNLCYECSPMYVVNDQEKKIIWNIPKPVCATKVSPDSSIVQASVDQYLSTLACCEGMGGSEDEPVTVDDLESADSKPKVTMLIRNYMNRTDNPYTVKIYKDGMEVKQVSYQGVALEIELDKGSYLFEIQNLSYPEYQDDPKTFDIQSDVNIELKVEYYD